MDSIIKAPAHGCGGDASQSVPQSPDLARSPSKEMPATTKRKREYTPKEFQRLVGDSSEVQGRPLFPRAKRVALHPRLPPEVDPPQFDLQQSQLLTGDAALPTPTTKSRSPQFDLPHSQLLTGTAALYGSPGHCHHSMQSLSKLQVGGHEAPGLSTKGFGRPGRQDGSLETNSDSVDNLVSQLSLAP